MRVAPLFENTQVGAGVVLLEPYDTLGVRTGLRDVGNADQFNLTFDPDVLTMYSSRTHSKGLYGEIPRRVNARFQIQSKDFIEETVRMALLATRSRLVQVATPVVDEPVATSFEAGLEYYFRTAKLGPITAFSLKFNAITGVLGTDYVIVNANVGLVRILPTTTKVGPVLASYTPTAYTATTGPSVLALGRAPIIKVRLLYIADNLQGPNRIIDIPVASIRPNGAHDLISDDFGNIVLQGSVYEDTVNNPNAPYGTDTWYGDALP